MVVLCYDLMSLEVASYESISLHVVSHVSLQIVSSLQMKQNKKLDDVYIPKYIIKHTF